MTDSEKGKISLCPLGTNSVVKDLGNSEAPGKTRGWRGWDQVPIDEN
jgi:hypothetical protein